jgi:FixJ family two-component response regulator
MNSQSEELVYVVDDDEAVRDSLEMLFRSIGLPARCFKSAEEFLDSYEDSFNGCLVLDIRMPGMSGLELQEELIARHSAVSIVFISGHGDIPMAVMAVKKGALDFISKPFREQDLLDCVQRALKQSAAQQDLAAAAQHTEKNLNLLSPREREVLSLMIEGKANKVIALELEISQRTVEVHRSNVMEKMGTRSLAQLVKMVTALPETGTS